MDAILDLTSRAVSLIVLIQDSLIRLHAENHKLPLTTYKDRFFPEFSAPGSRILDLNYFKINGGKISWVSIEPALNIEGPAEHCFDRCIELITWLNNGENFEIFEAKFRGCKYFPAPEQWREAIREVLYKRKPQRLELANALQYLPLQITLTVKEVTRLDAKLQRLLQIWNVTDAADINKMISSADEKLYHELLDAREILVKTADDFLVKEDKLIEILKENEVPLSFLQIFHAELHEIELSRKSRRSEIESCSQLPAPSSDSLSSDQTEVKSASEYLALHNASFETIFKTVLAKPGEKLQQEAIVPLSLTTLPETGSGGGTNEKINYTPNNEATHDFGDDVIQSSKQMELWALAFSGGGIRSATFNLGILQGLAKKGLLSKFDYLSTVSGGGYIGSWLVSWIYRNRSVIKVSDRLDPKKSSDPFAEEVRPIRWLRMYSNYLTPTTGVMSTDSWTTGMTLLRNMLINQLVILSLCLSVIAAGRFVFMAWMETLQSNHFIIERTMADLTFNIASGILLLASAVVAGLGMYAYHRKDTPKTSLPINLQNNLTHVLIIISCISAILLSTWIYRHATIYGLFPDFDNFGETYLYFTGVMIIGVASLLAVASIGRYESCIPQNGSKKSLEMFYGFILTAVSIAIGGILLVLACKIGLYIASESSMFSEVSYHQQKLAFICLPPLVIEVLSITVVLRMAFLGASFPDERREWWGRIGGLIHRTSLLWIVFLFMTMFGKAVLDYCLTNQYNIKEFFVAGWGATLLVGLKAAFSGKTTGEGTTKKAPSPITETLALVAPYLFVFGLMIFLPQLLDLIQKGMESLVPDVGKDNVFLILAMAVALAVITLILSVRIGVNQFSMHLFYRNRLIRAYLGATRVRIERQRSANPFTNFDSADDILMADLTHKNNYFGPYPIINTTLSASADTTLDRQDRKAESFIFSPYYCGYDFSRTRATANALKKSYDYAYRPTGEYAYPEGPHIGTAMAISGAAANPNMGYHTSSATAFLLSLFNIRLGWWMGNPRKGKWKRADPKYGLGYLISDLTGSTDTTSQFVCLSDGAHFDNMGLYELIRRKCKYIVLCDGEQDENLLLEGLANAIRRCRIDFGVEISFENIENITDLTDKHFSKNNYAIGKISYAQSDQHEGILIFIKASMTEKESVDLQEYAKKNTTFPHQSTGDQFFNEEQFESYRKLGMNIIDKIIP